MREDIGRHNAVDKVVGRLLLDGALPATDLGLFVSGRASFEIVQKAWAAGFAPVVAVSAPSSLAVEAATAGRHHARRLRPRRRGSTSTPDRPTAREASRPRWQRPGGGRWAGASSSPAGARAVGGLAPNGIGQQKPHHYRDMAKVAWANRAHPIYAWTC